MSGSSSDPTTIVTQALNTLYHDPDSANKRRANEWLEEFQHSIEAWQTCHTLLTAPNAPLEGRLFAAQTFRAKILYDLSQLPRESLPPLRDSLLASLAPLTQPNAPSGSRAVLVQLCLALSDLALQMPEWDNVVGSMIERFGNDPTTVNVLLGFLKCLVEESGNHRIPLSSEETRAVLTGLISGSAEQVLGMLSVYIQASGITPAIQISIFETLRSWLSAGELMAAQVAQTPLFSTIFDALVSDQLFDAAVDVICDLIHETQEVEDNVEVIQLIVPRVVALRPELEHHKDDPDRIRGYCRIFCEAGECYHDLVARHPGDLLPIVEAISVCTAYPDLDIVPITFNFWYLLSEAIVRQSPEEHFQPFLDAFSNLQTVIIRHLQFPADDEEQSGQERDEFRTFRHRMGDTLKDCCRVLGASRCLEKSCELVVVAYTGQKSWQEIEAPLFSMRSMGAEVDPANDDVLGRIFDLLPMLPLTHPRIRYATILVISRYTEWLDRNPDKIGANLEFISAGFDVADEQVSAAAAQAMKFMCQDCHQHLVPFLPQLHQFVTSVGKKLDQADMVEVCEAIGYVISSMPAEGAASALQQFCEPLIQRVQAVAMAEGQPAKSELQDAADALEQVDAYLTVVRTLNPVPESCFPTAVSIYGILDTLLSRFANLYYISERASSILRRGLAFFPARALEPVIQAVLERMASCFDSTGYASYLWIIGKIVGKFGDAAKGPGGEVLAAMLVRVWEGVTTALSKVLQTQAATEIPDVMDDYVHCFSVYLSTLPQLTLSSPSLHLSLAHTLSALTCPTPDTIMISLDVLSQLSRLLAENANYQSFIQPVFIQYGQAIVGLVIGGVVQGYPDEGLTQVREIVNAVVEVGRGSGDIERWMAEAVNGIPGHVVPTTEKQAFLQELHLHLQEPPANRLKNALDGLVRAARRARERGRQARKSLGGL